MSYNEEAIQRLAKVESKQEMILERQNEMSLKLDNLNSAVAGTLATHSTEIDNLKSRQGDHSKLIWGIVLLIVSALGYSKLLS